MERVLHNGIAASTGADGTTFFYSNPLQLRTGHDGSGEDAPSERLKLVSVCLLPAESGPAAGEPAVVPGQRR